MTADSELLQRYTRENSQEAFSELVRSHLDLVYSAALRQVRSPQLAEEVSQSVFTDLARDAGKLKPRTILTAWLYQVTRRTAIDVVRRESRRQARERIAAEMAAMNTTADWTHIEPFLDDAMDSLDETDRTAILLRYFDNKSLREVGEALGATDDAAQKRVSRAVERLREFFSKRGVTLGASGLVVIISANAVQSAPLALATTISTTAVLASTTIHTSTAIAATKAIAMTTLQKALIGATVAVAIGANIHQAQKASSLQRQNQTLERQQASLTAQLQQLQQERDDATNRVARLSEDNERLNQNTLELLKLRSELTQLKSGQPAIKTPANSASYSSVVTTNADRSSEDIGREIGMAVIRGDAGAFDRLLALSKSEHEIFNTNSVGLDDQRRGELSSRTFAPVTAAFDVISAEAAIGNHLALDAANRALQTPYLKSLATRPLGMLAGNGDENSLEMLLNPEKYGLTLSSAVSSLQPAANSGNQKAIDALANVAKDETKQPLWLLAADGLAQAAENGNPVALDALIGLSTSTNRNVRNEVIPALETAAGNQNAKAAEALRAMRNQ